MAARRKYGNTTPRPVRALVTPHRAVAAIEEYRRGVVLPFETPALAPNTPADVAYADEVARRIGSRRRG
jgi:hypothetical protein